MAVDEGLAALGVQRQVGGLEHPAQHLAGAAQQGPQARHQLLEIEGLDQIVVRAALQPRDALMQSTASGEHQDRRAILPAAHLPQHRRTIAIGQAQIQDHRRIARALQGVGGVLGRFGLVDIEALRFQAPAQQLGQLFVILDDQQPHGRGAPFRFVAATRAFGRDSRL